MNIRKDFPIFNRNVNGYPLAYLDNAATTQKPVQVLDAMRDYYENSNSNIHRSVHKLSEEATELYEKSREKVAEFVGSRPEETIFTRNATESINLVMYSWACRNLTKGDEILLTIMEHHSNIVPWQHLQESNGIKLRYVDINEDGTLDMNQLQNIIGKKTRLVAVTQCSNVLGSINPIKEIAKIAHDYNALCMVDGSQSVPHMPVDMKDLGCDFLAFSGHKMLGPMGIGVLCVRGIFEDGGDDDNRNANGNSNSNSNANYNPNNKISPFIYGGDMIKEVDMYETTFNSIPWKFEAGTPNVGGAVGLAAAIEYLNKISMDNVKKHEDALLKHALKNIPATLKIYGNSENKSGIISFNIGDVHSHDLASVMNDYGIAIRSGHGCAMPLMKRLGVSSVSRASFYVYNTIEEVTRFIQVLENAKRIFRL